jgi:hypothetical protein
MSCKAVLLAALCAVVAPLIANAGVTNGGFESGDLTGWSHLGYTLAQTSSIGVTPTAGTYQGFIDNTGNFSASAAAVATALGVSGPTIAGLGAGTPTTGSAISQTLTVTAGDVLTFDWNFLTDEHNEGVAYNDFVIYTIDSSAFFLASRDSTFFTLDLASPPPGFDGQTHWATESYTFTSSGTFNVGYAVFNVGDAGHDSVLLVDAVSITPEPASLGLLVIGAAGLLRRVRSH